MDELTIKKQKEHDVLTVFAEGRIDTDTTPKFDAEVSPSLDGITKLVLDFEKVSYISSSALRVILKLQRKMGEVNGRLIIRKPTDLVTEVLEVTGFLDILNIEK